MIRCLAVVPPGGSMPVGLQSAGAQSRWRTATVEWKPGSSIKSVLSGAEVAVLAGWGTEEIPHEVALVLANECWETMEVARFPVVVIDGPLPLNKSVSQANSSALAWHGGASNDAGLAKHVETLALARRTRRRVSLRQTVLAAFGLLLMSTVLGAGLLTLWAAGFDPALQEALVLLDGLEGSKPRLLEGESLAAWHDRLQGLDAWQPASLASQELETRVNTARELLRSWIQPIDLAARWPEVEDAGSLKRLRHLAESIHEFNPALSGFSESPLGKDALLHRDEIVAAVRDADRQIEETFRRMEARRELLALARHRTASGVDWVGWYQATEPYLQETMVVAHDAPVRALDELRDAQLAELESLADLRRARVMVNALGLAGPGPAYLVPPASGATLALAAERMDAVLQADPHALADLVAAGLPGAFVNGISSAVEAARNAWLAGGGKELVARLKPEGTGIEAWRQSLELMKAQPSVSRWNQWIGFLAAMERAGAGGSNLPPLDELQRYFATNTKPIVPTAGIVVLDDMIEGEMVLVVQNTKAPETKLQMNLKFKERKSEGWILAFRPLDKVGLHWAVGDPCTATLMLGEKILAEWSAPATLAVGTEGIWGPSSSGLKARLRWDPAGAVPEPPAWWLRGVR